MSEAKIVERLKPVAMEAAARAYCPYSNFRVGTVVEADDGRTFSGCNVENASYGLACCAERNALFKAVSEGVAPSQIRTVVIYTPSKRPYTSCGACRQVMSELAPDAHVISTCDGPETVSRTVKELLPAPFAL